MSSRALFTGQARADIREAGAWIAQDSPSAAKAFRQALIAAAERIGDHPKIGVVRPDVARDPYRFVVVRGFPYIIIYDPTRNPPAIARVVHGARDLPEVLKDL